MLGNLGACHGSVHCRGQIVRKGLELVIRRHGVDLCKVEPTGRYMVPGVIDIAEVHALVKELEERLAWSKMSWGIDDSNPNGTPIRRVSDGDIAVSK